MESGRINHILGIIHQRLTDTYGFQHWWPAEEPFEVMVGAILTQSVAWHNAEKAINNLKRAKVLSPQATRHLAVSELAKIIHPCGYYNNKALRLKALAKWLGHQYDDDIKKLITVNISSLRQQLLSIRGVGQETADSILLYAVDKPTFVIDAYTRRIIDRLGLTPDDNNYAGYQSLFMDNLAADVWLFNEYHALLVKLAQNACNKKPLCRRCCLIDICWFNKSVLCINSCR